MTNVIDDAMKGVSKRRGSIKGKMFVCLFSQSEHCEGAILVIFGEAK